MRWLIAKLDRLVGTVVAVAFGIAGSQFVQFVQQYRQGLAGQLAEAQFNMRQTREGPVSRAVGPEEQRAALGALGDRATDLTEAGKALATTSPLELPWVFLRVADWEIVRNTSAEFQPSVPSDASSLLYAGVGVAVGWLVYSLAKRPFRRRRRRK